MAGSSFGTIFKITTWGESHGKALGVVVDGCPAGLSLCEADIQVYLNRRKPGQASIATTRREDDLVEILSGVFEGKTTGTPISLLVPNTSQHSGDYAEIASFYRPSHADYTFDAKYGFRDYRGGGRSSGRETIGRVAAGAIALTLLKELGIQVQAYTKAIGPVTISQERFDAEAILHTPTAMPDYTASKDAEAYLASCMQKKDSAGGIIECVVSNLPAGLGEPVFEKLDANLSKAIMSIGAVKAFEIGDGTLCASLNGSTHNDAFVVTNGSIATQTNHAGGTLGGISSGSPLLLRAYIKPTPSIACVQNTVTQEKEPIQISIKGRHDPVIVPRAVVVVEAMTALTLADAILINLSSKMQTLTDYYGKTDES